MLLFAFRMLLLASKVLIFAFGSLLIAFKVLLFAFRLLLIASKSLLIAFGSLFAPSEKQGIKVLRSPLQAKSKAEEYYALRFERGSNPRKGIRFLLQAKSEA